MKIKKSGKFFKSLRFRILIILIILGIVPSVIVTEMVIANYEDRAIANRVQSMEISVTSCATCLSKRII